MISVIAGRQPADIDRWLLDQPRFAKAVVTMTVCDLHESFGEALHSHLPLASAMPDRFHSVAVGIRCVDPTR